MKRLGKMLAVTAWLVTVPAFAQEAPPPPAETAQACEIHVWPGSDLIHLYYGWFHGGTVDGAAKGRDGYPDAPPNPLTAQVQGQLLSGMGLPTLLNLPDYRVVMHPQPLTSREIRSSTTRLADSQSPCYAELMVDDLLLSQNVISGAGLRSSFRFRDFGPDAAPRRQFGNFVLTKLKVFPPKTPELMAEATSELRGAFVSNAIQFARALTKPPKRK